MRPLRIETRCNQRCLFCCVDPQSSAENYALSPAELRRRVLEAPPNGVIEISGGEPTLSPLLPLAVKIARDNGRHAIIQTNGMRFADRRYADGMQAAGLEQVFVSLHAPHARLSDALTRRPGGFDLTVQGIHNLLARHVLVRFSFVICRANRRQIVETVRFIADEFGAGHRIVTSYINPHHQALKAPNLICRISSFMDELKAAVALGERRGMTMNIPDVCGLPMCVLAGLERFSEKLIKLEHGETFRPHSEKTCGPQCRGCCYDGICDGLWTYYADRYGFDELVAVRKPAEVFKPYL